MVCLSEEQIFHLVDESVRSNDLAEADSADAIAHELEARSHLATCASCRAIEAQLRSLVSGLSTEVPVSLVSHKESVARAIEAERIAPRSLSTRQSLPVWKRSLAPTGALIALAACTMLFLRSSRVPTDLGEFSARGTFAESLTKDVGITLRAVGLVDPIREGTYVSTSAKLFASYRNAGKKGAFAMVVLQDAKGELHWIYPAYLDPKSDPQSIPLAPAAKEAPLPDGSVLEDVPLGEATFFTLVSAEPHTVSTLEKMAPLSLAKLGQLQPFTIAKSIRVTLQ